MIKNSLMFLAGTIFATGCMVAAGGRAPLMIGLGAFVAFGLVAGLLWLCGVRRVVRFLTALADALESSRPAARAAADPSGYRKPSRKQQLHILNDTIEEYRSRQTPRGSRESHDHNEFLNDHNEFLNDHNEFLNDAELFGGKVA